MTDFLTQQQPLALTSSPTRGLRLPLTLLRHLFSSRRTPQIDLRCANDHFLKDIGLDRSNEVAPSSSHYRPW
ncbi:hypothetical protein [Flavimaricola marinus]|uniref:DUF1127 domain-containing protein n=1 Tax=Flavimaricola marinus TaxID=1819565 RepID=A0A238L9J6_9RHOB|nr:hypothetical protein [Flavimaricola marinus]SMY06359.1 hypothetical protein LOM8899_00482 [Flavimaricola marinus]